jgi:hypothetical protein
LVFIGRDDQLLAAVDFDLAFGLEQTMNFFSDPPVADPSTCVNAMQGEVNMLMADIGGIAATRAGVFDHLDPRPQPMGEAGTLLWAARDVAVQAYVEGYCAPGWMGPAITREMMAMGWEAVELTRDAQS